MVAELNSLEVHQDQQVLLREPLVVAEEDSLEVHTDLAVLLHEPLVVAEEDSLEVHTDLQVLLREPLVIVALFLFSAFALLAAALVLHLGVVAYTHPVAVELLLEVATSVHSHLHQKWVHTAEENLSETV